MDKRNGEKLNENDELNQKGIGEDNLEGKVIDKYDEEDEYDEVEYSNYRKKKIIKIIKS